MLLAEPIVDAGIGSAAFRNALEASQYTFASGNLRCPISS
jgi:hypothetical protein